MGRGHRESHAGQTVVVGSTAAGSGDPTGTRELWEVGGASRKQEREMGTRKLGSPVGWKPP